ncbi:hypothetical protein LJC27_04555 [Christensenellaceae bacterium OttesenSCG-928-M15]|nr:hypothetical protein [Christensenellaceae bacterium OttesenSCG-928-M15]
MSIKRRMSRSLISAIQICLALLLFAGCAQEAPVQGQASDPTPTPQYETALEQYEQTADPKKKSTPENDLDIGLKNLKVDTTQGDLTEDERTVLEYFAQDYFFINSYDFLMRYPEVFQGMQVKLWCVVEKILKTDNEGYELLVNMAEGYDSLRPSFDRWEGLYYDDNESGPGYVNKSGRRIVIKGRHEDARFMVNDILVIEGRYLSLDQFDVDGTTVIAPFINVHKAFLNNYQDVDEPLSTDDYYGIKFEPYRMTLADIKQVGKVVFGSNIEFSAPVEDIDYYLDIDGYIPDPNSFYVCTLDNQTNAKFTKYYFYKTGSMIEDASIGMEEQRSRYRYLEFAPDFSHFYLFSTDGNLDTLTVEYYNTQLNKLWSREFDTAAAHYDYTAQNVYLSTGNHFYVINVETGEDTFPPTFIGKKLEVRKLENGILTIGEDKTDAVIMTDLQGNILWTTSLPGDVWMIDGIQLNDDQIVVYATLNFGDWDLESHFIVLDANTGDIIKDAKVDYSYFIDVG